MSIDNKLTVWVVKFPGFYKTEYDPTDTILKDVLGDINRIRLEKCWGLVDAYVFRKDLSTFKLNVAKRYVDYVNSVISFHGISLTMQDVVRFINNPIERIYVSLHYRDRYLENWISRHHDRVCEVLIENYKIVLPETWLIDACRDYGKTSIVLGVLLDLDTCFNPDHARSFVEPDFKLVASKYNELTTQEAIT
jgi:hypothetical protein